VYDAFELVKFNSRLTRLVLRYTVCQVMEEENTKALSNLRYLNLCFTTPGGSGEVSLRHMPALEKLKISHPFRSLASSRLTELSLFGAAVKSLSVNSASLSNLKSLEVTFSPTADADISKSVLQSLAALESLKLRFSPNEDFYTIYNNITATNLTRLDLRGWKVPEPINITSLNSLALTYQQDAECGDISQLTNLTYLECATSSDKKLVLPRMTKIKQLGLYGSTTALDFHHFKDLELLDIELFTQHDLIGIESATGLTSLRIFSSSENNLVVDFGFLQNLTALKEIAVSDIVSQNFWQNLRGLTSLKSLEFPRMEQEEHVLLLTTLRNLRVFSTTAPTLDGKFIFN
jgi:hypothetical protein